VPPPTVLEPFLFLYITEKCQLRCRHCYMGERLDAERRMSAADVERLLVYLRVAHGQYKVYLLGGEPTTHPELDEILDVCQRQGFKVVVTSNGLIPPRTWPLLDSRVDSMSFSLDGAHAKTHEGMRGPNTFRPLLASIRTAVAAEMQTRAIFTVSAANVQDVPDAIDLADDLGLEMLSFHYFTPVGLGRGMADLQLPPSRWLEVCAGIRAASHGRRVRLFYPPAFADSSELQRLTGLGYRGCTARSLERLAVFPDGRVYICSMFFDTDLHYGEFVDGRIRPRPGTAGGELTLVNSLSDNCRACPLGGSCRGGCAAYDHLRTALVSSECDAGLAPVCPLWSVPAQPEDTAARLQDLR
jgi:radical SAM protein with 4Fe4S-binding SPASM domain